VRSDFPHLRLGSTADARRGPPSPGTIILQLLLDHPDRVGDLVLAEPARLDPQPNTRAAAPTGV